MNRGATCKACGSPFAAVPDDIAAELNTRSQVCPCDVIPVHQALVSMGLAPLDAGSRHAGEPPVDDGLLREGGWPVTPALSWERGDNDARWPADEDLPPFAEVTRADAWVRLYADAWAVEVARVLVDASSARVRARCVRVLLRGAADPEFRAATTAARRIGGNGAFRAALLTRPPR